MSDLKEVQLNLLKEHEDLCSIGLSMNICTECNSCEYKNKLYVKSQFESDIYEMKLESLAKLLREKWINKSHDATKHIFCSPALAQRVEFQEIFNKIHFSYERSLEPIYAEKNIDRTYSGWFSKTTLFSSCMIGMHCLIDVIRFLHVSQPKLHMLFQCAYYETVKMMKLFYEDSFIIHYCLTEDNNVLPDEQIDIYFFEPITLDEQLAIVKWDKVIDHLLKASSTKMIYIIVDTTLLDCAFDMKILLDKCRLLDRVFIFNVRSLLKLSQLGFEFANGGAVTIYCKQEDEKNAKKFLSVFEDCRSILGAGPSLRQATLYDFNLFDNNQDYIFTILKNNSDFAKALQNKKSDLIDKVVHPSLNGEGDCPFLYVFFKDNSKDFCFKVASILNNQLKLRGLSPEIGNSFGFRNCRFEIINFYSTTRNETCHLLRIAIGKIKGNKYYCLLTSLCRLNELYNQNE